MYQEDDSYKPNVNRCNLAMLKKKKKKNKLFNQQLFDQEITKNAL